MGAEPWMYFVPHQNDIDAALESLRQQEFEAGRYSGSEDKPESIAEAFENADASGTASILDMMGVSPTREFCHVTPLDDAQLTSYFGTDRPTRAMIEANSDYFDDIDRGHGIYTVVYKDDQPHELFFAGYSFD